MTYGRRGNPPWRKASIFTLKREINRAEMSQGAKLFRVKLYVVTYTSGVLMLSTRLIAIHSMAPLLVSCIVAICYPLWPEEDGYKGDTARPRNEF